jgi:cytosine/adenosine deaminase-related metal-dependent hydrolase
LSLLLAPEWLVTTASEPPKRDWGVRIEGGTVAEVGPNAALAEAGADEIVALPGRIVMPGFVNTHTHMYGALAHGIPVSEAPTGFWSFLEDFWWPNVEDVLDHDMIRTATDWVCAEMLTSGTTSFYDILEAPKAIPDALFVQKEVLGWRGIRGTLSFEATERVSEANGRLGLDENVRFIEDCKKSPGLISGMMCYHTTFTCSPRFIQTAFELAAEHQVACHAHCNEGMHEPEWCLSKYGKRTLEFYATLGVLSPGFLASQCVQLSAHELALLVEAGVKVAHMPLSNCEVGGGIAPAPELANAGVVMGLGTDGYINDMHEVMRGAFLIHKGRLQDPRVMPAATVIQMATEGGAAALGMEKVGRLAPGWSADLQVVDAFFPTPITEGNLYDQLVLWRSGNHVTDVMVGGEWRVRNGTLLQADIETLRAHLHEQAERLWAKA